MLIQAVRFTFAPQDGDKTETMFRELRDGSRAEPGVIAFDVGRGQEAPVVFALWEVYRHQAAFDFYKNTQHFAHLVVNGVRPLQRNAAR